MIINTIKAGNINAGDPRPLSQESLFPSGIFPLPFTEHAQKLQPRLLTFANYKQIDEIRHRLRVEGTAPAGYHQRPRVASLGSKDRYPREVKHIEHIGISKLISQREPQNIEILDRAPGLQAEQRQARTAHLGFHVHPGRSEEHTSEL